MGRRVADSANKLIEDELTKQLKELERYFGADVLTFIGSIAYGVDDAIRDGVEFKAPKRPKLVVIVETHGGSIQVVQRIVDTLRHHYQYVDFVIPNHAMSAGTVLALSGDAIHMDYYSILGPIDPQLLRYGSRRPVPALGYLVQYDRLIEKSRNGELTTAELLFLMKKFNPAELYEFEQARDLSITLLRQWLVKYKFKDWTETETRKLPVTDAMREERAKEIAEALNKTDRWHSHSRGITMDVLRNDLKLQIEDFGAQQELRQKIRTYNKFLSDYMHKRGNEAVLHTNNEYVPLASYSF